jgi:hypothetical protein
MKQQHATIYRKHLPKAFTETRSQLMKIALVGSAPASVRGAPYGDQSWQIYGCSPGVYGIAGRVTEWFEMHLWEPGQTWFSPEYCQWLKALPGRGVTLWTGAPVGDLPGSEVFPADRLQAIHDPQRWFGTSSLFWMMARAMEVIQVTAAREGRHVNPRDDKIGFWGVDMAAESEYEMQRAGVHFMAYKAAAMGIEVGAPPESDLFTPRFRYGVDEWTHSYRKIRARRMELEQKKRESEATAKLHGEAVRFFEGALEDLKYCGDTWAAKGAHLGITPVFQAAEASEHGMVVDNLVQAADLRREVKLTAAVAANRKAARYLKPKLPPGL